MSEAMLEIEDGAFSVSKAKIPEFINNYLSSMAKGQVAQPFITLGFVTEHLRRF